MCRVNICDIYIYIYAIYIYINIYIYIYIYIYIEMWHLRVVRTHPSGVRKPRHSMTGAIRLSYDSIWPRMTPNTGPGFACAICRDTTPPPPAARPRLVREGWKGEMIPGEMIPRTGPGRYVVTDGRDSEHARGPGVARARARSVATRRRRPCQNSPISRGELRAIESQGEMPRRAAEASSRGPSDDEEGRRVASQRDPSRRSFRPRSRDRARRESSRVARQGSRSAPRLSFRATHTAPPPPPRRASVRRRLPSRAAGRPFWRSRPTVLAFLR